MRYAGNVTNLLPGRPTKVVAQHREKSLAAVEPRNPLRFRLAATIEARIVRFVVRRPIQIGYVQLEIGTNERGLGSLADIGRDIVHAVAPLVVERTSLGDLLSWSPATG